MLQFIRVRKQLKSTCARYYVQKKLPADPDHARDIPVYEYPEKPQSETILYCWGLGEHGAVGHYFDKKGKMHGIMDPRFKIFRKPFRHSLGEYHNVTDIAAGFGFTAFSIKSRKQNKVWGTGINSDSQIGYHSVKRNRTLDLLLSPAPINLNLKDPAKTKIISMSAGRAHLAIVTDLEGVCTLGNNSYGQCGRTIIDNEKYSASQIVHKMPSVGGEKVKSVECGQDHTLFLTENGNVYSCGWGADGQTGLGHYDLQPFPSRVLGDIEGEKIVKISSKSDCVLAINDKGDVFGWGNSEYSQLLDQLDGRQQLSKPLHLKKCSGFGKIIDVAAAGSFCLMLNDLGNVFSWGYGILGRGPNVSQSWVPKLIPPILFGKNDFQPDCKVVGIYCGLYSSGAINNYGHIYTWGKNKSGCLGLGHLDDQYFPLRVFLGNRAQKLAMGVDHTIALCRPT